MKTLTIWSNHGVSPSQSERLQGALASHRLLLGAPASELANADVAFGQPPAAEAAASTRLRWVALSSAGYTPYSKREIQSALSARGARLSTSSGVYAEPCAEHVMAFMLAWARRLPDALYEQRGERRWIQGDVRRRSVLLVEQRVMIFGYGSIGSRLAAMLAPFTPHVVGVRRTVRGDEPIETFGFDDPRVDAELARAQHVINVLPAADSTARYFDATRIARIAPGAVFYNVGRGTTVDQTALAQRLHDGSLGAAWLDVTDPEPLPPEHPLWTTPNCFITPHSAGGHHNEGDRLVEHFIANFERYVQDEPLLDRVL